MITVGISSRAAAQVARGQLWIFSNEIFSKPADAAPGSWVWFAFRDKVVATGYFNPHSLIAGRAVALGQRHDRARLLEERLEAAFARRLEVIGSGAARLVYSEADFLPGLILDYYGAGDGVLVAQSNTAGIDAALPDLEAAIGPVFQRVFGRKAGALVVRADAPIRRLEGVEDFSRQSWGDAAAVSGGVFSEGDVKYAGDFLGGQKTGFFLDQRDNRAFFAAQARARKFGAVLDLFCYSGGWGLAALKAGAEHVTFVDQSEDALALAKKGLELNGLSAGRARFVKADAMEFLEKESGRFDAIVADPPAFVKSKKNLGPALRAYEKLNRLSWRRLQPGGLLMTCSCSYHLSESDFLDVLREAVGKERGVAAIVYRGGQGPDHPELLSMPETRYLKCLGLQKSASWIPAEPPPVE